MELKVGDETKENIEMNDDDDDLESIQFGKNFRRKRNININTCTFHSLSQRVSLREIFESKLEGRNFCANFPTVSQRARER